LTPGPLKLNIPLLVTSAFAFLGYVFVVIKIKLYQQKHFSNSENINILKKVKSVVAKFLVLALTLATVVPALILSTFLSSTDPRNLGKPPFYYFIQMPLHVFPSLCIANLAASLVLNNKKLEQSLWRDFISLIGP
jgi:hypothetical protein